MEKAKGKNPWYTSKTKWAGLLLGISAIFGTLGTALQGDMQWTTALTQLVGEVGGVLAVFGIRDLPFINKK